MKKLLILSLSIITAVAFLSPTTLRGQPTYKALTPSKATLTNTDTSDVQVDAPTFPRFNVATFTVTVGKTSGTTAAGTVWLEGSNNGTKYGLISAKSDTLRNVTEQTKSFTVGSANGENGFKYYRIRVISSGTWVGSVPSGSAYFITK